MTSLFGFHELSRDFLLTPHFAPPASPPQIKSAPAKNPPTQENITDPNQQATKER